jgi:hypothetical protein
MVGPDSVGLGSVGVTTMVRLPAIGSMLTSRRGASSVRANISRSSSLQPGGISPRSNPFAMIGGCVVVEYSMIAPSAERNATRSPLCESEIVLVLPEIPSGVIVRGAVPSTSVSDQPSHIVVEPVGLRDRHVAGFDLARLAPVQWDV